MTNFAIKGHFPWRSIAKEHKRIQYKKREPKRVHMDINFGPLSGIPIPAANSASSWVCGAGPAICFNLYKQK